MLAHDIGQWHCLARVQVHKKGRDRAAIEWFAAFHVAHLMVEGESLVAQRFKLGDDFQHCAGPGKQMSTGLHFHGHRTEIIVSHLGADDTEVMPQMGGRIAETGDIKLIQQIAVFITFQQPDHRAVGDGAQSSVNH